ncbi:serine/threonine protein kinase [Lusitaniella coriacea LEGE 07157]|uniref:non-specific serine/threonine protein kinase n=1 Tax=Lusitaniella coriacea LEGE 07157 TaxID=945747 RepID=A0A8J7DTX4_9CYAN|nr:serine/threonine-protein kinase [Lusitaniella coriacea]MBE9114441.1 serine/threonine protein kinase [Lusitaniella coriacea LEGE 07157]
MLKVGSNAAAPERLLNKRYHVIAVLSSVGLGKTYTAVDTYRPGQPKCVIKCLTPVSRDRDCLQVVRHLFDREAQILAALEDCDRVPQLFDRVEIDRTFYLIQEFIEGQSLNEIFHLSRPWNEPQTVAFLQDILGILAFAHPKGIIHSDLRPDKLILRQKDAKWVLTGFNVLNQERSQWANLPNQISASIALGTLGYMPVEQLRGKPLPSSDIYSLGMMGIQALTGLNPVELEEDPRTGEVLWQHQANVSDELAAILSKMVCYHIRDRYSDVQEVLEALQALPIVDSEPIDRLPQEAPVSSLAVVPPPPEPQAGWYLSSLRAASLVTFISAIAGASGFFFLRSPELLSQIEQWFDFGRDPLAQAKGKYQDGELEAAIALARSIAPESPVYSDAQSAIAQWQKDWKNAQTTVEAATQAFQKGQWQTVLQKAEQIPDIKYWQEKVATLVERATINLDRQAQQTLEEAYSQARDKNFTRALDTLKEIPPKTATHAKAKEKIAEYRTKQSIRANYFLQQAYNRAVERDFTEALDFLAKIPPQTPAYATAQGKVAEYKRKQNIKANHLLQRAYNRAIVRDFNGALRHLQQIPENTIAYAKAQEKIAEYSSVQGRSITPQPQPFKSDPFIRSQKSQQPEAIPTSTLPLPPNLNPGNQLYEINTP